MFKQDGIRIIFIDDEVRTLESLMAEVQGMGLGWELEYYQDLNRAFQSFDGERPTLIVSSQKEPSDEGVKICEAVMEEKLLNRHPVYLVVLSKLSDLETLQSVLGRGADDYCPRTVDPLELIARIKVGVREIHLKNQLVELNQKLLWESQRDSVTHLYNRRFGQELLKRELEKVERGIQDLSLLLLDIDYFRQVNERCGHGFGDHVLFETATILQDSLRKYDVVLRWGEDQFLLILPNTDLENSFMLGKRLLASIEKKHFATDSHPNAGTITASVGIAVRPKDSIGTVESFVDNLEESLKIAKEKGRNQVQSLHKVFQ